jgi:hypothetical protein
MFRVKVFADANATGFCAAHPCTISVADSPNQSGDRQFAQDDKKKYLSITKQHVAWLELPVS